MGGEWEGRVSGRGSGRVGLVGGEREGRVSGRGSGRVG